MGIDFGESDEQRQQVFPLAVDKASPQEYTAAKTRLQRFSEMDINEIHTLEDLSAHAGLVGEDIALIVVGTGTLEEADWGGNRVDRRYVLEKPIDDNCTIILKTDGLRHLTAHKIEGEKGKASQKYHAYIPISEMHAGTEFPSIHATEGSLGPNNYYPLESPNDSHQQQGYARVIQQVVKDVLAVSPASSTKIPDIFLREES